MDRDELRRHIDSAAPGHRPDSRRIARLILRACLPDEPEYVTERVALDRLRHGDPEPIVVRLPTCSCSTGRCVVCN
jgi:hypothetical protein